MNTQNKLQKSRKVATMNANLIGRLNEEESEFSEIKWGSVDKEHKNFDLIGYFIYVPTRDLVS